MACASDILIASSNATFCLPEVKVGLIPATISPYVIRRCGEAAARELMLTGRKFTAREAERFMLSNRTVNEESLELESERRGSYIEGVVCKQPLHGGKGGGLGGPHGATRARNRVCSWSRPAEDRVESMRWATTRARTG